MRLKKQPFNHKKPIFVYIIHIIHNTTAGFIDALSTTATTRQCIILYHVELGCKTVNTNYNVCEKKLLLPMSKF